MVPLQRLALPALAFLFLFGSCDRVSTPQESEVPSKLDLTFGVWTDSAEAARDSLRQDRPLLGNITVGDTLWVRVKADGDTSLIRSVDAYFAGSWQEVPVPVFFPVAWQDSGRQKVKVAIFTEDDQFLDSMFVMVTNRTPVARLPVLPGDGSLRVLPNSPTSIFVQTEDDGRIDSLRWDLDGDGMLDTATSPNDTLRLQWTIERILRARSHPVLRVFARDEDGNESSDSFALSLELPPPSITLSGPDTVSIGDSLHFTTTATGSAPLLPVTWQDDSQGEQWHGTAPASDTVLLVRAILRDSLGNADTAERSVVVLRDAPDIVAQDTIRVHAGRSVRLSAGAVQRFGSILRWGWDLDGDGTFGRPDTTAGIDTVFETKGLRRVGLSATDDDGNVGLGSILVLVTDSVPTLSVSAPRQLGLGDTATIAALSADPDGDSLVVGIVVDGDTAIGSRRLVRFDSAGTHIVGATVRSYTPAGTLLTEVSIFDTILVVQDPPRLDLGSDTTIAWGGTWRAVGATASDSTGSIATTEWDWDGDGTWDTLATGWLAPIHRFLGDTGRTVVLARVTDDDGNRVLDSLILRLDPSPWKVEISAPSTSPRLSDIVVNLTWTDSMSAGSTVRWTSNDGLDTTRNPVGDADSMVVQGRLGDTLRLSASLVSPSGAITTRTVEVVLEALAEGPEIFLSGPDTVSWGDTILIAAETVSNGNASTISWWDESTGSLGRSIAPAGDTVLQLRAVVRDALGRADSAVHTVVVVRDAPVADAGPDLIAHAGSSMRFSGAATQRFGGIVEWAWDLDWDGTYSTSSSSAGIDTTWETTGPRTVVLRVRDDDGNVAHDTILVTVTDSAPTLSVVVPSVSAMRDTLALVATASDPDDDSLVVLWVVDGDTTTGSSRLVAFDSVGIHVAQAIALSFTEAGTLLATTTVTDTILVVADPPRLDLGSDTTVAWGGTWRAVSASASDSTGTIATTEWDWDGNGTWDTTINGWSAPSHRFQGDTGSVLVRARVTDDDGNRVLDSLTLRVDPAPWDVILTAPESSPRLADIVVRLSWSDSMPSGTTVRWTSNEDLDTVRSPLLDSDSLILQARLADSLIVTATIRSPSGATTTRRVAIGLGALGAPPTISISGPDTLSWNDTIRLSAVVSGLVTPASVTWWNQRTGLTNSLVAPPNDTILTLKARIVDSLGRTDSATKTVVVVRDAPQADAGGDRSVHAGTLVRLSGSATQRFGSIVQWGWDLDGDGIYGNSATLAGIDTTWETVGPRRVVLRTEDDDGNVDHDTIVVTVADQAPTLSLAFPTTVVAPNTAVLVANAADPDDDSLNVFWVVDGDTLKGASHGVSFSTGGQHSVSATVRTYTRPGGTFLAEVTETGTIEVTSEIAVELVHPDTVFADTSVNGVLLQTQITSPGGLRSIEWSFDNGSEWTTGSLSGDQVWRPEGLGTKTVLVRVTDLFGATDSDTAYVENASDRPLIDLPDSITVAADSRSAKIPLEASVRFGDISSVRWRWTDADSADGEDQNPEPGSTVVSPLVHSFAPGRFTVHVTVIDVHGDFATDSVVVSSAGIRVAITQAPTRVATRGNVHAEATYEVWPADSAIEYGFTFDGADFVGTTSIDVRPPEAGTLPLEFWANFQGSQVRVPDMRMVEVVYDPPQIETFSEETIGEGTLKDFSFSATRNIGGIATWIWDLSATLYQEQVRLGIVTDAKVDNGTLSPRSLPVGNFQIGYGVIDDAGDTTWAQRYITVVGAPEAVDDVLGKPGRSGVDVPCEVGVECVIRSNFLLDNDLIGRGLEAIPEIVEVLDGATLQSNSDGTTVRLPAPSVAGPHTFRYVISNGYLKDTGSVEITIYAQTEAAGFNPGALGVAIADNNLRRKWGPGEYFIWNPVIPRKDQDLYEYVAFYLDVPTVIGGAQLKTGNTPSATGPDSVAPPGENLYAIDPNLSFYLEHGPTDWMVGEEEVHDFKIRVGTRRTDNLGIPGHTAWADYTLPVTFARRVWGSAKPDPKYATFAPTYNCDGSTIFDYAIDVDPIQNPHADDLLRIKISDLPPANKGLGYQDGDITAVFTDYNDKTTEVVFKRDKNNWIVGNVPTTGGKLTLRYTINGMLDGSVALQGEFRMSWVPEGGNSKSTQIGPGTATQFTLGTTCKNQ